MTVVVLGSHTFGMLSNNFRLIWALEKLCSITLSLFRRTCIIPYISFTISPFIMVKDLYWRVRVANFLKHLCCPHSWSLKSLKSDCLNLICKSFIFIFRHCQLRSILPYCWVAWSQTLFASSLLLELWFICHIWLW